MQKRHVTAPLFLKRIRLLLTPHPRVAELMFCTDIYKILFCQLQTKMEKQLDLKLLCSALQRAKKLGWFISTDKGSAEDTYRVLLPRVICANCNLEDHIARKEWFDNLHAQDILTIIRFDEPQYPDEEAEERGISYVSCEYENDIPNPGVVCSFLYTVRTSGSNGVAVHLDRREGRAGTLCSLHLMHGYGFSAGEALTWLRLMFPSINVKETQRDFLEAVGRGVDGFDETSAGGRDMAFRRAVYRVWAKNLRRGCHGSRPESSYETDGGERPAESQGLCGCGGLPLSAGPLRLAGCVLEALRAADRGCAAGEEPVSAGETLSTIPAQAAMQ